LGIGQPGEQPRGSLVQRRLAEEHQLAGREPRGRSDLGAELFAYGTDEIAGGLPARFQLRIVVAGEFLVNGNRQRSYVVNPGRRAGATPRAASHNGVSVEP